MTVKGPHLPPVVGLPIRDVLRGLESLAEITESNLEAAGKAIPQPLRVSLGAILNVLQLVGKQLSASEVELGQIRLAVGFVDGTRSDVTGAEALARILTHAWEILCSDDDPDRILWSETVTAARLVSMPRVTDQLPHDRAALILDRLHNVHDMGKLPGDQQSQASGDHDARDIIPIAVLVWLLAERGDDLAEEDQLLKMAYALAKATHGKFGVADAARQLEYLAARL